MANKISEDQAKAIKSLYESYNDINDLSDSFTQKLSEQDQLLLSHLDSKKKLSAAEKETLKNLRNNSESLSLQNGLIKQIGSNFSTINIEGGKFNKIIKGLMQPQLAFLTLLQLSSERFSELDMGAENFRKETGLLASQTKLIESNVADLSLSMQEYGVGIKEAYAAAKGLTDTFGDQFMASNKQNVEYVALMNANFGVGADMSSEVLQNFMGIGKMSSETARYMTTAAASLSKAAGIPFNKVMQDVAKASGETLAAIRGNVPELIKASVEARRLGTDINAVGAAASRLLDFQTSVGEEMEASVLMGKDLNLQKARELAYAGDLAGLAQEQSRIVQNAGKMDFYQQKALANALGMSVEQVTKMQAKQQELSDLRKQDPDFARKYEEEMRKMNDLGKESNEDLKKKYEQELKTQQIQAIQTKLANQFKTLIAEIADVLTPVFEGLGLVADILGTVVHWIAKANEYTHNWGGRIVLILALTRTRMLSAFVNPFKLGLTAAKDYFVKLGSFVMGKNKGFGPQLPSAGENVGGGISKSVSESVKNINPTQLIKVAAAMVLFAGSLLILAYAAKVFGSPEAQAGFTNMGIAAIGLAVIGAALIYFSGAITAAAPVILPAIGILLGFSAAIGILALAAMGFGKAFNYFVDGFVTMSNLNLLSLAGGFYVLSGAILAFGASMAIGGIGAFIGGGMMLQLGALALMAPLLSISADALRNIGESLTMFKNKEIVDGIHAVTEAIHELNKEISNVSLLKVGALAALNTTSAAAGVAGGGAGSAEVVGKLDELIGLMKSGAIAVNIDSSRANYLLARGQKERGALGAV